MSGQDLVYCLGFSLTASTQEVPYYPWRINGGAWGDVWNDWQGTRGDYSTATNATTSPLIPLSVANYNIVSNVAGTWANASGLFQGGFDGPFGVPPLLAGQVGTAPNFQVVWGPSASNSFPPMSDNNTGTFQLSPPLFYYFGLRPGETSYHTFIRMYVDEELADSVI